MKRVLCSIVLAAFLVFCSSQVNLIPLSSATPAIPDAAADSAADIHVLVEPQSWTGSSQILSKVTPVRVTIENKSGNLLRVRTSEFAFFDEKGTKYAALPPYDVKGSIDVPVVPGFTEDHFLIAPYFSMYFPDIPACPADFHYDDDYYNTYYPTYLRFQLPTKEMLQLALPDGVVDVGGHVSGFLYFQKIPTNEKNIKFTAKLINAVNGDLMGTIIIPFRVVKK